MYVCICNGVTEREIRSAASAGITSLEALRAELTRLHPAEILHPDNQALNDGIQGHKTPYPAWRFEPGKCEEVLLTHFKASTLEGFGI